MPDTQCFDELPTDLSGVPDILQDLVVELQVYKKTLIGPLISRPYIMQ